ncbi:MAG: hypothetical protein PVI80_17040, partial [Anaerolineae bacterium]
GRRSPDRALSTSASVGRRSPSVLGEGHPTEPIPPQPALGEGHPTEPIPPQPALGEGLPTEPIPPQPALGEGLPTEPIPPGSAPFRLGLETFGEQN